MGGCDGPRSTDGRSGQSDRVTGIHPLNIFAPARFAWRYDSSEGTNTVILCDLCGQAKECSPRQIEGREYDICADCWNPLAEKLKGKGRMKKERETVFLPPLKRTGAARIEASTGRTAEDLGTGWLAAIDELKGKARKVVKHLPIFSLEGQIRKRTSSEEEVYVDY